MGNVRVPVFILASAWFAMLALLGFLWYSVSQPHTAFSSQLILFILILLTVTFGILFAWLWRQNNPKDVIVPSKDLISVVAHELRTPLTSIVGYVSVLQHENARNLTPDQKMFLNRIKVSAKHVRALTENLLNVSKLERNILTIHKEKIDYEAFIESAIADFQTQAQDRGIELDLIKPTKPLPQIAVDPLRMGEVVTNLVANALTYTPPGGKITVTVETKDNAIVTHIADNGPGIPSEALPQLFTKFYRVNSDEGSKGTGLGLYISKAIVAMHKGSIWVDSTPGRGSTFSFTLPTT